jgi:hypothetical protein
MAETKEAQSQEQEDQGHGWLGDFVRITIMLWAMGIITANYLGYFKGSIDVTFSASLLASTASTYGLTMNRTGKKKKDDNGVNVDNSNTRSGIK